jgi:hypothetical protein
MANMSFRSCAEGTRTRNPRLRSGSSKPALLSSSSASLTGVVETPQAFATVGTVRISPGLILPETISKRMRCNIDERRFASNASSPDAGSAVISACVPIPCCSPRSRDPFFDHPKFTLYWWYRVTRYYPIIV